MENGLHCQGREGQRDTETRGNSSYSPHAGDPIFKARIETLNTIMNEISFPCLPAEGSEVLQQIYFFVKQCFPCAT